MELIYIQKVGQLILVEELTSQAQQARGFQYFPRVPINFGYKFPNMPVGSMFHMLNVPEALLFVGVANGRIVLNEVHPPNVARVKVKGEDIYEINPQFFDYITLDSVIEPVTISKELHIYKHREIPGEVKILDHSIRTMQFEKVPTPDRILVFK